MGEQWYIFRDEKNYGPYSEDEVRLFIKQGILDAPDLLWNKVIDNWKPVEWFPQFSEDLAAISQAKVPLKEYPKHPKKRNTALTIGLASGAVIVLAVLAIFLPRLFDGDSSISAVNQFGPWSYATTISEPITTLAGGQDSIIGDLKSHGVSIQIPAEFLDNEAEVTLTHPSEDYDLKDTKFSLLGVPIEILHNAEQKRFNEPVKIAMQFDNTGINEEGEVYAAYFHPTLGWDFYYPDKVDLEQGIAEFSVYHFSAYAVVQVDDEQRISDFLQQRAVEQYVRGQAGEEAAEHVEAMVQLILREGMEIKDNETISIIARAVIEELPGGKVGLMIYDLDSDAFIKKLTEETVKKAGKTLTDKEKGFGWEEGLFTDAAANQGQVKTLAEAAGYFVEGNNEEALKVLAAAIADEIPVIKSIKKAGEVAAKVVSHNIDVWKHQEVEKAYRTYRDGASGGWLGRDVDPGDWDQLLSQTGGRTGDGAFRQVRIDYIKNWCDARGIDPNSLSRDEYVRLGDQAMENLKQQFDTRRIREAEIAEIRAKDMALIELLEKKGLLAREFKNPMYTSRTENYPDLEMLLNRCLIMAERIKSETGRMEIVDAVDRDRADPHDREKMISRQDVADLIWTYYYNGEQAYRDLMIERKLVKEDNKIDDQDLKDDENRDEPELLLLAVPNLTGQDRSSAEQDLNNMGLSANVSTESHDSIQEGKVIRQQPAAGTMVPPGSSVSLIVSSGLARLTVPDVIGQEGNAAVRLLDQAGYKYLAALDHHESVAAGFVIDQHPKAGTELALGSTVKILVSRGPEIKTPAQSTIPAQSTQPAQPVQPEPPTGIPINGTFSPQSGGFFKDLSISYSVSGAVAAKREPDSISQTTAFRRYSGVKVSQGATTVTLSGTVGGSAFAEAQYQGRVIVEIAVADKSDKQDFWVDSGPGSFNVSVPVSAADVGKPVYFSVKGGTYWPNGFFNINLNGGN